MRNKKNYNVKIVMTAVVLSSLLLGSCASSRNARSADTTPKSEKDTVEEFTPTHPPIVVKKSWREVMEE